MSAQLKKREEANTPEVNLVSLVVGTTPLAPEEIEHRKGFWEFVEKHGAPWHKQHLGRLLELWLQWNEEHFASALIPPYILLSEPASPNVLGGCARISGFGARSQIRIRPSLLRGDHPHVRPGLSYAEGRFLFVADVLLHEMIHQYQQEVTGNTEESYHGHGPMFRDIANEIGEKLGLSLVRTSKNRGKEKDLPSCAQWPHCVRPDEFYQGANRGRSSICSTQELCAAATSFATDSTDENLLKLGKAAVAYDTALKAKKAKRDLLGNEEDDVSLVVGTD